MPKASILTLTFLLSCCLSPIMGWVWPKTTADPDYCYPDQVHINLGEAYYNSLSENTKKLAEKNGDASVIITWQTQQECSDNYLEIKSITAGEVYSETFNSNKLSLDKIDQLVEARKNDGAEGTYKSFSHTASIKGLKPNIQYSYSVKNGKGVTAGPFTFKLPDTSPKSEQQVRFAIYADIDTNLTNDTINRISTLQKTPATAFDFTLFLGDVSYDIYSESGIRGEYFWNTPTNLHAQVPFMLTPGNHEWYRNYTFLNFRTKMPLYSQTQNQYFSFNVGKIHFLSLNYYFYHDEPEALQKQMFDWIENDLKEANATRGDRPWIIAYTHQPVYCSLNDPTDKDTHRCYYFYTLNKNFEELYNKYKVDFVLSGHVHLWERTAPTFNNKTQKYFSWSEQQKNSHIINPTAPIYTIEGSAGNNYYMAPMPNVTNNNYSMNVNTALGFSTITLVNNSAIKYEHINSKTGDLIDYFYLLKGDQYKGVPIEPPSDPNNTKKPVFWIVLGVISALAILIGILISRRFNKRVDDLKESLVRQKERRDVEIYEI